MGSRRLVIAVLALLAATTACASGGASTASTADAGDEGAPTSRSRTNRNVLTSDELSATPQTNMLDAVTALRPQWLRGANTNSFGTSSARTGITVYVDGQPLGAMDALRTMDVRSVERASYRTTSEAQNRYGMRVVTPVVDIQTVSRKP